MSGTLAQIIFFFTNMLANQVQIYFSSVVDNVQIMKTTLIFASNIKLIVVDEAKVVLQNL